MADRVLVWVRAHAAELVEYGYLAFSTFFLEIVFKVSTTGGFVPQLLLIALFSASLGAVGYLLASLSHKPLVNRAVKLGLLVALALLFSIEYFVYREFKLFYDPATVLAGAGGVATQFGGTAASLVFSASGLIHVLLFAAPALGYVVLALRGRDVALPATPWERLCAGVVAVGSYLVALALIALLGAYGQTYSSRYSFDTSVTNFGLVTSMRKEVQNAVTGGGPSTAFVEQEAPSEADEDEKDEKPATYGTSEMDIDFAALAAGADGTYAQLDAYVASLAPSSKNAQTGLFEGYNLIFISAEAFSAEAIREDITPTLYRMATKGIQFTDYYQFDTAGTTGGECANIFGLLATEGGNSVKGTASHNNYLTLGSVLGRLGYNGWAFHNNTYTYYDRHLTHNNLGYSNGFTGYGNGMERWVTWQWPQSDVEMLSGTFDDVYGSQEPFNVYYMSVSGHSDYTQYDNAMSAKNWDVVADLPYSDPVKAYLAANVELDRALEYLIGRLEETGIADHTAIVIGADHFPYGLDDDGPLGQLPYTSELYGYDVQNIFQRDHNRLIVWSGSLEKEEPLVVSAPTSSIDILPTMLNLFGAEWDSRLLPGRDVFSDAAPLVFDLSYDWKTDLGTYYAGSGRFEPMEGAEIPEGYVDSINTVVANKISYCHGVLTSDYYGHVFAGA